MCSALSSVPGYEANKENNEESCISTSQEAKLYLIHAVSKLRLYAQVDFRNLLIFACRLSTVTSIKGSELDIKYCCYELFFILLITESNNSHK